jgi:Tfp pilus assembly protein PilX
LRRFCTVDNLSKIKIGVEVNIKSKQEKLWRSVLANESGISLIMFLAIVSLLAVLALGALQSANLNILSSDSHKKIKRAFYSAEVGLDLAVDAIITEFENLSAYTQSADYAGADGDGFISRTFNNYTVSYKVTNPSGKFVYQTVSGNNLINHYAHTYNIEAKSVSTKDGSKNDLKETVRILETPLVQFFIFYGGSGNAADLEILPGPTLNSWGRIHSNGDIYVGTNNYFNLRNYDESGIISPHAMTATGSIYLKRKNNGSTYSGDHVVVKTASTGTSFTPTTTFTGDITKDNEESEESRFGNYVLVNEDILTATNKTAFNRGGFYETRAGDPDASNIDGIKIVGTGGVGEGITITVSQPTANTDVTSLLATNPPSISEGVTSTTVDSPPIYESTSAFTDNREDRAVSFTDIDLNLLQQWYVEYLSNQSLSLKSASDSDGGGGILVYASRSANASSANDSDPMQAIRLVKSVTPQLLDETTVASDNAIYVQGDFNTVSTRGVALIGDAVNILSNNWSDPGGCNSASNTTYNAAFFGGNVPTPEGGGTYSGGLENYPRMHESWSGKTAYINGSFINLWSSSQATGSWSYGCPVYTAPTRTWGWDVNFQNPSYWPPFIPSIFSVERVGQIE